VGDEVEITVLIERVKLGPDRKPLNVK